MTTNAKRTSCLPLGMPQGRRSPRGKSRWYLVRTPEGREQSTCDKVRSVVAPELLSDAFVMYKERWVKRDGQWSLTPVQMYKQYFFVATPDARALDEQLAKLSFPARIAGTDEHAYVPLSTEAQQWYESVMDDSHTLRNSTAIIQDGTLHVKEGPLVGQEPRVRKIDRHKRDCRVAVCEGADGVFAETLPLEVPFKS